MKNLPIGKKLFLGFGLVIVLIVLILGVTVVTSFQRSKLLNRVEQMSALQDQATEMQANFLTGRIELRTVYTKYDESALESYSKAKAEINESLANLSNIENMVPDMAAETRDNYTELNKNLSSMFNDFIPMVDAINEQNIAVMHNVEIINGSFEEMAKTADTLYDIAIVNLENYIKEDPAKAITYMKNVVLPVEKLIVLIDELRVSAADFTYGFDTTVVEDLRAQIDNMLLHIDGIRGYMVLPKGLEASQTVIDAINTCMEEAATMRAYIDKSEELIQQARDLTQSLDEYMEAGVIQIAKEMDELLNSVTVSSYVAMIIQMVIVLFAIIIAISVGVVVSRSISGPLKRMKDVLVMVGETGKMEFDEATVKQVAIDSSAKDEVGQSTKAFSILMKRLLYISSCLDHIASGNLTQEIEPLSKDDVIGNSMKKVTDHLNQMFLEIRSVASQVTSASNEIAQGAQSLAQGSTEQASTVEEISASVNEINEQMNVSNETSTEAAQQGREISQIAQEGNAKMEQMMVATQEINDASTNIGNVIKVIDDIAFQTNILALNAAVEAARAGEHGKGFAVVADEVRSLAGKSAEAAKETAALISENIEKAEFGMQVSQQTAEILSQIIDGIRSSSESIQKLADQSQQAKVATAQVNQAVDQVSHVVQQNSATSEESAAASEEMSSQAHVLQELLSKFTLREMGMNSSAGRTNQRAIESGEYTENMPNSGEVIF